MRGSKSGGERMCVWCGLVMIGVVSAVVVSGMWMIIAYSISLRIGYADGRAECDAVEYARVELA